MTVRYDKRLSILSEPMTLTEAKLWCRIDDDDTSQDAIILKIIRMARQMAESITEQSFARQTRERCLDDFPSGDRDPLYLQSPLVSIQYVTYAATSGSSITISGSPDAWDLISGSDDSPGWIIPIYGTTWPDVLDQVGAVRVGYTSGYAATSQMPETAWQYMQALTSTFYEFREQIAKGNTSPLPRDLCVGLLDNLRTRNFFA